MCVMGVGFSLSLGEPTALLYKSVGGKNRQYFFGKPKTVFYNEISNKNDPFMTFDLVVDPKSQK